MNISSGNVEIANNNKNDNNLQAIAVRYNYMHLFSMYNPSAGSLFEINLNWWTEIEISIFCNISVHI